MAKLLYGTFDREAPRETPAERLKAMSTTPGARFELEEDGRTLTVRGDDDALDTVLRRATHAAGIMGLSLGHIRGRSLVLRLAVPDGK